MTVWEFELRGHSRRRFLASAIAVAVFALTGLAACGTAGPTPSPDYTSVPIGPTPWPNGTTGQYGLHIDPSLLKRLPITIGGIALSEDAGEEEQRMADPELPKTIDRLAAAMASPDLTAQDVLRLEIVHFKAEAQNEDAYTAWIDQYTTEACSQASGIAESHQETINNIWLTDVSTCNGGVAVYSVSLGDGQYLSMFDIGPKDLGRMLLNNLF